MRNTFRLLVVSTLLVWQVAAQEPVGIFDDHQDVGEPTEFGLASFDQATGRYSVEGPGETIGDETFIDQFHFVFKQMSGSFAIEGIPMPDIGGRGGLMIRQDLEPDAVHVSFLMTSAEAADGDSALFSVFPTFRTLKGGGTVRAGDDEDAPGLTETHTGKIRLERLGGSIHFYTLDKAGNKVFWQTEIAPLDDAVFAGLAVSAESRTGIAYFEFEKVAIEEFPLTVFRTLPTEKYQPGAKLSPVTVTARVRQGQKADASVHEVLPEGAMMSNVRASTGQVTPNADGTIDWTLTGFTGEALLTYDLTLGQSQSAVWRGTFNDGINRESYIGGPIILPKNPTFTPQGPFVVDLVLPTLIQAEWATPAGNEEDFGLFVDPRIRNGISVVSMTGFSSRTALEFELIIPKDDTYYFFGNVRGEDGNSDSFHAEVDDVPAGNNSSRWNINSEKQYLHEWLSCEDPYRDPRPFQLTAGSHILQIANRENSAKIDWIAVTNNPNVDPEDFIEESRAVVTRQIPSIFLEAGVTQSPVELTAYVAVGVSDKAVVREIPPTGFSAEAVNPSAGTAALSPDGTISWDLTGISGRSVTLRYQAVASPGTRGFSQFSGSTSVGSDTPVPTSGESVLYLSSVTPKEPTGKKAFLFLRLAENSAGDRVAVAYLEAVFGIKITQFDDTNVSGYEMPADLTGADMAFVSGTVGSGNVAGMNYHVNSPVPMVTLETWLNDDFAFQADVGRGDQDGTEIEIIDNTHPITQGFPLGPLKVWEEVMGMGHLENPPAGVRVLATVLGNPNRARLWVLEKNATANNVTTPGLRVGTWMGTEGLLYLNSNGLRLFNQIFAYALGEQPPAGIEDFSLY